MADAREEVDLADMPTDIEFTNILNRERDNASCSLLRVGDIKILLDCGCDERIHDKQMLGAAPSIGRVEAVAKDVHFIFVSHATVHHVGALPLLHERGILNNEKGNNVQAVLSTSPVAKVGAQTMYEFIIQKKELSEFNTFGLQNVEGAFS